jgi:predicted amidophosphoribosyltransferase
MKFLETHISQRVNLPVLPVIKLPWFFPAQKTLKKREDRIANASNSFAISLYTHSYERVLIIDDAVGSGATLVEIARKIIQKNTSTTCYAFSLVWTANGILSGVKKFEVLAAV